MTKPSRSWTATATCYISAAAALSVIGSIFAGIYTKVTRIAPEKASELATAILDIGERIEHATSQDALDALQDELEAILRGAVIGLRDGTISSDGLDTFKLGYEFVRDEIAMRRESLKRHASHDDNVVIVKTAQRVASSRNLTRRGIRAGTERPRPDLRDGALERDLPRIGHDGGARLRDGAGKIGEAAARRRRSAWPGRR